MQITWNTTLGSVKIVELIHFFLLVRGSRVFVAVKRAVRRAGMIVKTGGAWLVI
jgi:hypothetical protein